MKTYAVVALGAILFSATPASAYSLDFNMINETDEPIVLMWSSPTTDPDYHKVPDFYIAANGGSAQQTFDGTATGDGCYYDLKFQFQGGSQSTINHLDLCKIRTLKIEVQDGKVVYDAS